MSFFNRRVDDSNMNDSKYPKDEKYWNKERENWEINGKPYTYRVSIPTENYQRDFTDVDTGYEHYKLLCKSRSEKRVIWEHIPPEL